MTVVNPTRGVELTGSTGSIAVYFDRGNPAVAATFSGSVAVYYDPSNPVVNPSVAYNSGVVGGTTQRFVQAVDTASSVRLIANSGVDVGDVDILSIAAGNNNIGDVDIVSGTLTNITNTVGVYFDRANPAVSANYGSGTFLVAFDRANPSVSIGGASSSIGVFFDRANPAVSANYGSGTFLVAFDRANPSVSIGGASSSIGVFFDRANPAVNLTSGTLTSITNTVAVYFDRANPSVSATFSGSIAVYYDQSNPKVRLGTDVLNTSGTASVASAGGSVSGSTSTAGNTTVVSPEASRNIKVYAFSLTTTAVVNIAPRFTTGASAGLTELWRVGIGGSPGANLAVSPPAYLFATGSGNTLALYIDSASLVHYSVAYFKESA